MQIIVMIWMKIILLLASANSITNSTPYIVLTMQSTGSIIASKVTIKCKWFWYWVEIFPLFPYTLPYSYKEYCGFAILWIPLCPDYWSRSTKHQLINCIHKDIQSHFFLSLRRAWRTHLPFESCHAREIFAYMSITIHYDRSSYNCISLSVTTNNNQVFCLSTQFQLAATSRNQRYCLCLRLDNDINEAVSPLSSLDAGQLVQLSL
jgi:hypothetical protein